MSLISFTPTDTPPSSTAPPPPDLLGRDFLPVGCNWRFVCPAHQFGLGPTYWCHVPTRSLWDEVSETWIGTHARWEGWLWTKTQSTVDALRDKATELTMSEPPLVEPERPRAPPPASPSGDRVSAPVCTAFATSFLIALVCGLL